MKTKILVLLLFSLTLSSCDPYILRVAIDGDGFEKSFNFEYGKVNVRCSVLADRQISTFLKFKLDFPISVNPEKLEITHRGEILTAEIHLNKMPLVVEIKNINNDDEIRIIVNRVVQVGDTIKINIDNFIVCYGKPLEIGDINLIFVSRR